MIQTHGNHLANVRQARSAEIYTEESTIFLFLPLAHSFAKLMGYIAFTRGVKLIFPSISSPRSSKPDPVRTMRDLALGSAKVLPIVPRILEKIKEGIQKRASKPGLAGTLLSLTLSNAERCYKNPSPSFADSLVFYLLTPLRKKIKKSIFGEHFLYAISGGAKLPVTIARFFDALQIEVLEGYGLTETCVATNVNRVGRKKIGSVGPVLASDIAARRGIMADLQSDYCEMAVDRIGQMRDGSLKIRPIGTPVFKPTGKEKVSQVPEEWLGLVK